MSTELRDQIAQALAEGHARRWNAAMEAAYGRGDIDELRIRDPGPGMWTNEAADVVGFIAAELRRLADEFVRAVADEGLDAFDLTELMRDRAAYLAPEPDRQENP